MREKPVRNTIFYLELVEHTSVIDENPPPPPAAVVVAKDEAAALAAVPAVEHPYEWVITRIGKADRGVAKKVVLKITAWNLPRTGYQIPPAIPREMIVNLPF